MGHCIYAVILKGDLVEDLDQDIRQKNITIQSNSLVKNLREWITAADTLTIQ